MNGIGITEWREHGLTSSYPLGGIMDPNDVFVDANFVQFDNFIPQLIQAVVSNNSIVFTILFDDGNFLLTVPADNCVEGTILPIRSSSRFYGQLVCGPGIETMFDANAGSTLAINLPFEPNTVRSIPSTSGLYTLQGLSGDVVVATDEAQFFNLTPPGTVTWNTVSKPDKVSYQTLSTSLLYSVTDQKQIVAVDPAGKIITPVFSIPIACNCIIAMTVSGVNKLVGTVGGDFYDLSAVPPTKILTIPYDVQALAVDPAGTLAVLTVGKLLYVELSTPLSPITATYTLQHTTDKGLLATGINQFLYTSPGPLDSSGKQVSNLFYTVNTATSTEALSAMHIGVDLVTNVDNTYQAAIIGMATMNSISYVATVDSYNNNVFSIDLTFGTAAELFSLPFDPYVGKLIGLTTGNGAQVTIPATTPLKTINGVAPVNNTIQLNGGGLIQVEQTNTDELTLNLAVDIANTTISPTTTYE